MPLPEVIGMGIHIALKRTPRTSDGMGDDGVMVKIVIATGFSSVLAVLWQYGPIDTVKYTANVS
jgi:hypothetical protein